jgi:hypothetical protein
MARTRTILFNACELMKTHAYEWRISHPQIIEQELTKMLFFLGSDQDLNIAPHIKKQFMDRGLAWLTSK